MAPCELEVRAADAARRRAAAREKRKELGAGVVEISATPRDRGLGFYGRCFADSTETRFFRGVSYEDGLDQARRYARTVLGAKEIRVAL